MSRSGYVDDCEYLNLYRGQVLNAIKGKRGQIFLADLCAALDAMPVKELIAGKFVDGPNVCALGAAARSRRFTDLETIDSRDHEGLAERFNVAACLIAEIEHNNDECAPWHFSPISNRWEQTETPTQRWERVRRWVHRKTTGDHAE